MEELHLTVGLRVMAWHGWGSLSLRGVAKCAGQGSYYMSCRRRSSQLCQPNLHEGPLAADSLSILPDSHLPCAGIFDTDSTWSFIQGFTDTMNLLSGDPVAGCAADAGAVLPVIDACVGTRVESRPGTG